MQSFSGDFPTLKDIGIAKNYLNDEELKILNNIVSGYFDFAEIQAMRHNPMYMSDYVEHLDNVLKTTGERCCREPVQSVMRRQLRRQQKSIENIRHRICHRLKRNIWKALKIFKA